NYIGQNLRLQKRERRTGAEASVQRPSACTLCVRSRSGQTELGSPRLPFFGCSRFVTALSERRQGIERERMSLAPFQDRRADVRKKSLSEAFLGINLLVEFLVSRQLLVIDRG